VTRVFLSHSHADRRFVRRLSADLERCGAKLWLDERELRVGDSVLRSIRKGIDQSDFFIVVLSPAAAASEWVQREIDVATTIEIRSGKKKVLPVLRGKVALPALLEGKFYADFRRNYRKGLDALLRALRFDDSSAAIMVAVLLNAVATESTVAYLCNQGFREESRWRPIQLVLEIPGGYFAYMRGDRNGDPTEPSLFQPQSALLLFDDLPILRRGDATIAFGPWRDEKFRGRDLSMVGEMEWRCVLYILGPAEEVRCIIDELLQDSNLPHGARVDLEMALKWWANPRFLGSTAPVTVLMQ